MRFKDFTIRFRSFGGLRLCKEYIRLNVLRPGIVAFFHCFWTRQTFKATYPVILRSVEPFLKKQYIGLLSERKEFYTANNYKQKRNNIIWYCWLQGLDQAPEIVQICYRSLKKLITDRKINVIDAKNWKEFVDLPEYIVTKWEKGRIPAALFSDLLRLELLIKYGGTWIDATVLCTGFDSLFTQKYRHYLDADLFLFQYTAPETAEGISISNWFITSCTNNVVLMVLRDMLYAYWKDYDCTLDYYIFHLFFEMVAREYPEIVAAMPYGRSQNSIALMLNWGKMFNQEKWDNLVSKVSFHKLSYRVPDDVKNNKGNYYNHIINGLREG